MQKKSNISNIRVETPQANDENSCSQFRLLTRSLTGKTYVTHTRARAHTHTLARTHAHTHTHANTNTRTHTHIHMQTQTHARTHAHTHTYTHTHTNALTEHISLLKYCNNNVCVRARVCGRGEGGR